VSVVMLSMVISSLSCCHPTFIENPTSNKLCSSPEWKSHTNLLSVLEIHGIFSSLGGLLYHGFRDRLRD
jgi:hypothetical protein